jgi:ribonuclease T1
MVSGRRRGAVVAAVLAAIAALVIVIIVNHQGSSGLGSAAAEPFRPASTGTTVQPPAGMPTVPLAQLPVEARDVVSKIDSGASFKYRQDGSTFSNREKRLPPERSGYYREYTVVTPGSPDRGPRRIISGRQGELYYTPDHYVSFQWIVRSASP